MPASFKQLSSIGTVFLLVFALMCLMSYSKFSAEHPGDAVTVAVETGRMSTSLAKSRLIYSYADLDRELCDEKVDWNKKSNHSEKLGCPQRGIVSMLAGGRTGNQMWEYSSILTVARDTGLKPYVPSCLKTLELIFELSLPTFNDIAHCPVQLSTFVDSPNAWINENQSVIIPRYRFQVSAVLKRIQEIIPEFTFRAKLRKAAQATLHKIRQQLPAKPYTFIGVHVRRTDFKAYLKRKYNIKLVNQKFYTKAMDFYRSKHSPHCVFVYISDDPAWCFKTFGHLPDVFVPGHKKKSTPEEDLALMAACNHSIFDYGTFGEWGSLLTKGHTICYNFSSIQTLFVKFLINVQSFVLNRLVNIPLPNNFNAIIPQYLR